MREGGTNQPAPVVYNVLRTVDVDDPALMTSLERDVGGAALSGQDQPWAVQARSGTEFRAYVGFNDTDQNSRTASVEIFRRTSAGAPTMSHRYRQRRAGSLGR